jgi:hypothetical protein
MDYTVKERKIKIMPHPEFVDHSEFDLVGDVDRFWKIVNEIVGSHGGWDKVGEVLTERPIMLNLRHPEEEDAPGFLVPGTCDLTIHFPHKNLLVVVDYKFGKGFVPSAENNLQLGGYGLGAWQHAPKELEINRLEVNLITLGTGHSSYMYNEDEMIELNNLLYWGAKAAMKEDAKRIVGSHCKYCKAFMTTACKPSTLVPDAMNKYGLTPAKLTLEQAVKVRDMKEVIGQGIAASESLIRHQLEQGKTIPGDKYYLGNPSTYRKIVDKEGFVEAARAAGIKIKTDITTNWTDIEKQLRKQRDVTVREAKQIIENELGEYFEIFHGKRPLKKA